MEEEFKLIMEKMSIREKIIIRLFKKTFIKVYNIVRIIIVNSSAI